MRTMIAIFFLALLSTNAIPVEAREFEEIPLPNYITIATAPAGLPADEAVFLGSWEGKWSGVQPTILVVTYIDPKTHEVRGIYGQDKSKGRSRAYSAPFTGKIGLDKR